MDGDVTHLRILRDEVGRLLADALRAEQRHENAMRQAEERHAADLARRDELHIAETERRDQLHIDETSRRDELHSAELAHLQTALENRDVIGQAKGIIMAT